MFCTKCNGTGQYLGNGMMMADCNRCDGYGTISPVTVNSSSVEPPSTASTASTANDAGFVDKRSRYYRDAIKDIMVKSPKMSRDEAMKLFDNAYAKNC